MKSSIKIVLTVFALISGMACKETRGKTDEKQPQISKNMNAKDILGNPDYLAISYGGYRTRTRDNQPTLDELKDDMKILHAMGIRIVRTYNVHLAQASNLLKAIQELKEADPDFEMYVMLGAWIDCKNAWTGKTPDHNVESERNKKEIATAVDLANQYPDIVKVLAVGNEAMVRWAESYYVQPWVILKWVNHLQDLKKSGKLPGELWITSSDDFASWGGGDDSYHTEDLAKLIKAVDYISMHTYPYHNSHYNPEFWRVPEDEAEMTDLEKIDSAMERALEFARNQYNAVTEHMRSVGVEKPVHIGETGWATISDGHYGPHGSRATDEYKQARYYHLMREWTNAEGISCFFFEAFDEPWKDSHNPKGSENHFGLFTVGGKAKYALWELVDEGTFDGITRNGNPITKSFEGNEEAVMRGVLVPPMKGE